MLLPVLLLVLQQVRSRQRTCRRTSWRCLQFGALNRHWKRVLLPALLLLLLQVHNRRRICRRTSWQSTRWLQVFDSFWCDIETAVRIGLIWWT